MLTIEARREYHRDVMRRRREDPEKYAYDVEYARKWHSNNLANRSKYLADECSNCGSTDNVEYDHIDPRTKKDTISYSIRVYSSDDQFLEELAKTQPLCVNCHRSKHSVWFYDGEFYVLKDFGPRPEWIKDAEWVDWFINRN